MKPSQILQTAIQFIGHGEPLLIKGAPGVGKSEIVAQAAGEAGADLVIFHPVISDPTDFKGFPFIVDGRARFMPFNDLEKLINPKKETVAFFDDLGQAPPSVQAACMQLFCARRIGDHKVHDRVTFIGATNRRADKAAVNAMLEPLKSRFTSIVQIDVDKDDWKKNYAIPYKFNTMLLAFLDWKPGMLHDFKPSSGPDQHPEPQDRGPCQ